MEQVCLKLTAITIFFRKLLIIISSFIFVFTIFVFKLNIFYQFQIHILVLAQILNRPIVVLPIESSKANMIPRCDKSVKEKHPMEGFYPQLAVFNNYRLCRPLFLCYANGCFHAVILPPPQRSPVFGRTLKSLYYNYNFKLFNRILF